MTSPICPQTSTRSGSAAPLVRSKSIALSRGTDCTPPLIARKERHPVRCVPAVRPQCQARRERHVFEIDSRSAQHDPAPGSRHPGRRRCRTSRARHRRRHPARRGRQPQQGRHRPTRRHPSQVLGARRELQAHARAATTRDGIEIPVGANIGSIEDAWTAAASGADLAGLVCTKFLFLDRAQAADVDEQDAAYCTLWRRSPAPSPRMCSSLLRGAGRGRTRHSARRRRVGCQQRRLSPRPHHRLTNGVSGREIMRWPPPATLRADWAIVHHQGWGSGLAAKSLCCRCAPKRT